MTKGVANVPWEGNPTPRVAEVYGGMLNAIGLQNPGIDLFIDRDIPFLKKYDTKIIVNVCGHTTEEYIDVVERLSDQPVDLLEINISCPNVKEGGIAFGQNPKMVEEVTKEMKRHAKQPVIMKLSPNVTDITEMARAAEAGGADALSMINTITGMKIDIHRRCFALANRTGGMSGPAVPECAGGKDSDYRNGRNPDGGGCHRDDSCRCDRSLGRYGELLSSACDGGDR